MSKDYYVYIHCRVNGDVVYVGKGKGNRAWATKRTDPVHSRWMHYCVQYEAPNVQIIERFLTEEEALKLETQLIEHYEKVGCKLFNRDKSKYYQRKLK